jgi:predicted nicotinamide N-methyase
MIDDKTILQIAREVTEIHTKLPYLATKEDLRQELAKHLKSPAHKKVFDKATTSKLVSVLIAALGAVAALLYSLM